MVDAIQPIKTPAASVSPETIALERGASAAVTTPRELKPVAGAGSAAAAPQDKVTLSAGAQAQQLLHQGKSVAQIAAALGTTTNAVDSYLGIVQSTSEPVAATPAPTTLPVGSIASQPTVRAV